VLGSPLVLPCLRPVLPRGEEGEGSLNCGGAGGHQTGARFWGRYKGPSSSRNLLKSRDEGKGSPEVLGDLGSIPSSPSFLSLSFFFQYCFLERSVENGVLSSSMGPEAALWYVLPECGVRGLGGR